MNRTFNDIKSIFIFFCNLDYMKISYCKIAEKRAKTVDQILKQHLTQTDTEA